MMCMQMLSMFPWVYRQQLLSTMRFLVAPILHIPANHSLRARAHTRLAHHTFLRSFLNAKEAEFDSAVGLEHSCTPSTWIQPNLLNLGYCSLRLYLRNKHWLSFHNRKLVSVVAEIIPTHLLNFHIIFLFCLSNKL